MIPIIFEAKEGPTASLNKKKDALFCKKKNVGDVFLVQEHFKKLLKYFLKNPNILRKKFWLFF